jgi:hypothetical protein
MEAIVGLSSIYLGNIAKFAFVTRFRRFGSSGEVSPNTEA